MCYLKPLSLWNFKMQHSKLIQYGCLFPNQSSYFKPITVLGHQAICPYHFWSLDTFTEAGGRLGKLVICFHIRIKSPDPLGTNWTGKVHPMLRLNISLKHETMKSFWHSAWHLVRAQEMSLTFSSQWLAALSEDSDTYPSVPPHVRSPGKITSGLPKTIW